MVELKMDGVRDVKRFIQIIQSKRRVSSKFYDKIQSNPDIPPHIKKLVKRIYKHHAKKTMKGGGAPADPIRNQSFKRPSLSGIAGDITEQFKKCKIVPEFQFGAPQGAKPVWNSSALNCPTHVPKHLEFEHSVGIVERSGFSRDCPLWDIMILPGELNVELNGLHHRQIGKPGSFGNAYKIWGERENDAQYVVKLFRNDPSITDAILANTVIFLTDDTFNTIVPLTTFQKYGNDYFLTRKNAPPHKIGYFTKICGGTVQEFFDKFVSSEVDILDMHIQALINKVMMCNKNNVVHGDIKLQNILYQDVKTGGVEFFLHDFDDPFLMSSNKITVSWQGEKDTIGQPINGTKYEGLHAMVSPLFANPIYYTLRSKMSRHGTSNLRISQEDVLFVQNKFVPSAPPTPPPTPELTPPDSNDKLSSPSDNAKLNIKPTQSVASPVSSMNLDMLHQNIVICHSPELRDAFDKIWELIGDTSSTFEAMLSKPISLQYLIQYSDMYSLGAALYFAGIACDETCKTNNRMQTLKNRMTTWGLAIIHAYYNTLLETQEDYLDLLKNKVRNIETAFSSGGKKKMDSKKEKTTITHFPTISKETYEQAANMRLIIQNGELFVKTKDGLKTTKEYNQQGGTRTTQ